MIQKLPSVEDSMPNSPIFSVLLMAILLGVPSSTVLADETNVSLAGKWRFQLDAKDAGVREKWFSRNLDDCMRDFTRQGNVFKNNGKNVILRGRWDCANYPLTGYAPMDQASWRKLPELQKTSGLNHTRFHSWCPPAAAFEAADEPGFYFQAELPNKRSAFNASDIEDAAVDHIDWLDETGDETGVSLYDYGKHEGEMISASFKDAETQEHLTSGGKGAMLICSIDLLGHPDKPEARQLLYSLLRYIDTPAFAPRDELDSTLLNKLMP